MADEYDSKYRFAIIDAGERFPKVLISSIGSSADLVGFYSLRQLGILPQDQNQRRDPVSELLGPARDHSRSTWIVDAWARPDASVELSVLRRASGQESKDSRPRNLALVVGGIRDPITLGPRGRRIREGLEKHLASLTRAIELADHEAIDFNLGLLTAVLAEVDRLSNYYRERAENFRKFLLNYVSILVAALTVTIAAYALLRGVIAEAPSIPR